jgi:glycosyltransferase involved in cell wall biosynthesis
MKSKEEIRRELDRIAPKTKTRGGLVSILIPIYGIFDIRRLILTIESIMSQKGTDIEIIVSEQGISPRLEGKLNSSVRYTFTYHQPKADLSDFNPGQIRNLAANLAKGEFLYTTDADVLFVNPYYIFVLIELIQQNQHLALYRPPMRRLVKENFEEFLNRVNSMGIGKAINSLDFSQPYIATTDGKRRELKVVTRQKNEYEKTFTTSMENFQRYIADPSLRGKEPTIWTEDRHCGANFVRRSQFDVVGGYCEKFINWGCEDSDLQWKLSQVFDLQLIPKEQQYEVLHLDHPRNYFSAEMWARNEEICAQRKQQGIIKSVKEDMENGK